MTMPVFDGLSAGEHAATAADAIRAINHLTARGDELDHPADAYAVLSDLMVMTGRLPQALDQLAAHLDTWAADPRTVVVDEGEFRGRPVTASAWLRGHATTAANQLYDALDHARDPLTWVSLAHSDDQKDTA
jgi:hypothetical protein